MAAKKKTKRSPEKTAEDRRADEEARRLAAVLRDSNDAVIVHDFDGKIRAWNRGAAEMTGYSEAEALAMNCKQLIPESENDKSLLYWQQLRQGERIASWETQRRTKDGRTLDVYVTATTLKDDRDQPVAIVKTERDITARKARETKLREQAERLRLAVSAGELGTWEWEFATDSLHWDARQFELFGIPPDEFRRVASHAIAAIHPEDRPRVEAGNARSRADGIPFREEFRVVHPDGSIRWLVGLGQPQRDEHGKVTRMIGVNFDITDRKRTEHELHQLNATLERQIAERTQAVYDREERLQAILTTAADAIITIDARGIIQSANAAAERMFLYTAAEMLGQNVKMLMPPPYRDEHDRYLEQYRKTGVGEIIGIGREVEAQRKDGVRIPVELAVSEVDHLGLFTGILRDITQRKQLEREVVEIASLEQRRIGQDLHDSVGQELTALNMLAGDLTASRLTNKTGDSKLIEQMVQGLKRCQRELRAVMRGLLPVAVDSEGLMAALSDLAERTRQEGKAACSFDCSKPVSVTDNLTATHLYLIAQEAVHNAIKHGRPKHVHITLNSDDRLMLSVRDDGIGMAAVPAENHGGLGLRIMRNRAAILGALLTIQPARPTGTLVTCVLARKNP